MGVPLIYLPTGVAFCFTAGIQLVTRSLDVFVWVVVRAGSPNISFFVAMPAVKESDVSEEFKVQLVIYVSPHFLKVHYAAAGGHYAAVHYWLCLGAYGTGIQVNLC
jgi:flagellar biosynthesis protein FliR